MTLRDELAAVLGPGNDDRVAYGQADGVLDLLRDKAEAADLSVALEQCVLPSAAEAKLARIEALLDSAENAPGRSFMRMHDGSPFPVLINALELRAILRGDQ